MQSKRERIGGLDTTLIGQFTEPKCLVVLCHGYGAPGDDLVGIGEAILGQLPETADTSLWAFPAAPIELEQMMGGRAWWPLNMAALAECVESGEYASMEEATPPGIAEARRMVTQLVESLVATYGVGYDQLILGGFSQGAMISTDVALHMPEKPALLALFSGALICRDRWRELAAADKKIKVLQSHGEVDPILSPAMGASLRQLLESQGHDVTFYSFVGGHTIPMPMVQALAGQVIDIVSG